MYSVIYSFLIDYVNIFYELEGKFSEEVIQI